MFCAFFNFQTHSRAEVRFSTSGGRPGLLVPDAFRGQEVSLSELLQLVWGRNL